MKVYLDNSATTALDRAVLDDMMPYLTEEYGNANSLHAFGRAAAKAVDKARSQVASAINAKPAEIYFTSGGTESDNWVLRGVASKYKPKGNHIIVSRVEHAAILSTARQLEQEGFEVTYLDVDKNGTIDLKQLEKSITDRTILVSVMAANNEIGTLQPIKKIVEIAKKKGVLVHTDAVQAVGSIAVDVKDLGVDFLSLSAHKFYGPKGIGALYKKSGVAIDPLLSGGHQERMLRGGTSNVPAIVGLGSAIERAAVGLEGNAKRICELRNYFVESIKQNIPDVTYNGDPTNRLPGNANFSFEYIEGEGILQMLDLQGIAVSTGSACSSGSLEPSHVMLAIGCSIEQSHSSVRFSFGKHNTREEADYTVEKLTKSIATLRAMSPLYPSDKQ